jgi:mono/diheme cytochrome c family protein
VIAFPVMAGLIAFAVVKTNADGFSARVPPTSIEAAFAIQARKLAVPASAVSLVNPVSDSPEVLAQARAHWADHCASCHANDGSGNAPMGKRMYPPAPDMRGPRTQKMTDGELFFIIENGVRMSGMPAWGEPGHDLQDSWKLVRFVRSLPRITPQEVLEMEKLNPKSPDDLKEEQEEREFLNGGKPVEPEPHSHH